MWDILTYAHIFVNENFFVLKILTTERFRKMGFEGPSRCILCKAHEEIVDYLLLNCPFSEKC